MNGDPLRVALLTYLGQPHTGGFGVYVRFLSRALARAGHEVDVFSGPPYPELDDAVNLIRIPSLGIFREQNYWKGLKPGTLTSWTDMVEWIGSLTGGFPLPYTFGRRVVRYFRKHRPDYDVIHDNAGLFYGLRTLQRWGYPVVSTVHHPNTIDRDIALAQTDGWLARGVIRRWYGFVRMQRRVIRDVDHLITVSRRTRRDIAQEYGIDPDRVDVVYNGIDTERFRPRPEIDRDPDRLMAVTSARWFRKNKGFELLMDAFQIVAKDRPGLKLILVGSPEEGGATGVELMNRGIADRVVFLEDVSFEKLIKLYARTSVFVVPSLYEGFGLPAAEAMACATPVVVTDAGGLPEVVGDAGRIVSPHDPEALAEAVGGLLDDPEGRNRLGRRGRRRVVEHFQWSRAARETRQVYRKVTTPA